MINTGAVKEYLLKFLNSVYCDTCANRDSEGSHCEDCYRKHMLWELSEQTAETMAKEISELKHELTAINGKEEFIRINGNFTTEKDYGLF